MTTPPPLSPDAQAILDAIGCSDPEYRYQPTARRFAAAAIRTAVDRLLPHENAPLLMRGHELERLCQRQHSRSLFLAIATELDGNTTTTSQEKT